MAAALNFALVLIIFMTVKRPSFVSANSVCYAFNGGYVQDIQSTRIATSIWIYKQETSLNVCHRPQNAAALVLLFLCGDIETCPGPRTICSSCSKLIRKNQSSERCISCERDSQCLIDRFEFGHEKM